MVNGAEKCAGPGAAGNPAHGDAAHGDSGQDNLGCLLIHGYGGSPFEMEGLAAALEEAGFAAHLVCLPGHGEAFADFAAFRFSDWLAHAEAELKAMLARHARVAIVGFSMGGTLALNLAARYPVAGVVSISTPVHVLTLWPWPLENLKFYARTVMSQARNLLAPLIPHKGTEPGETSRDIAPWQGFTGPLNIPQLVSMREGCAQTRHLLPRLTAPLLVMQDERDRLVNPDNAWAIARLAASGDTSVILTRMRENTTRHHMLPTHRETAALAAESVVRFCREKTLDR